MSELKPTALLEKSESSNKTVIKSSAENETNNSFQKILEQILETQETKAKWIIEGAAGATNWIKINHIKANKPEQGWKLHVSASVASAAEVMRRSLPVLLAENASFKFARSLETLATLNEGNGAKSQVGKFITVYPNNETQAVRLAAALDRATRGLSGPAVPSDRQLAPGSLVYYRYGGFGRQLLQTPLGEILPALVTPEGELVPDRRAVPYRAPEWVNDPFVAAGLAKTLPDAARPFIANTYYVIGKLYDSPRNKIYLAMDLGNNRRCVLKQANRGSGPEGDEALNRLRHEAKILQRLAPDPRFPAFYDLVEEEGSLYLAMEDLEGRSLEQHVQHLAAQGRNLPGEQVITWGRELASALAAIHSKGLVYRDLKSSNVMVAKEGHLRLLDFELTCEAGLPPLSYGLGTRGYMSPQQAARKPGAISDDVYSLGALLFFMATAAEPSMASNPSRLLARPLELLNPAISPALVQIIASCLDPEPSRRFNSMSELETALAECAGKAAIEPLPFGADPSIETGIESREHYRELAFRLADTLCYEAVAAPTGQGLAWISHHSGATGFASRDLNTGSSGATLALAELAAHSGQPQHHQTLTQATKWLKVAPASGKTLLPGLYVGEAGIGAALLRAGQVLGDASLIEAAAARGRQIAKLPHASPDLFNGTAGRLRFHLWLWAETGEAEQLEAAIQAGERLLETAQETENGGAQWVIPPGYDGLSGAAYAGYAHGAAGIADALLDLYEATGDTKFRETALQAGKWIASLALPALEDGSGLDWRRMEGAGPGGGLWCHGAAGVGLFFLHCDQLGIMPEAAELVRGAARMVARGTRWAGPVQCHGLAGSIEFLLSVYQAWGDPAYLAEAYTLGRLLEGFALEREGRLYWPSESPKVVAPDYMVGYAGIGLALLRLSHPEQIPQQLSCQGFRYRPQLVRD